MDWSQVLSSTWATLFTDGLKAWLGQLIGETSGSLNGLLPYFAFSLALLIVGEIISVFRGVTVGSPSYDEEHPNSLARGYQTRGGVVYTADDEEVGFSRKYLAEQGFNQGERAAIEDAENVTHYGDDGYHPESVSKSGVVTWSDGGDEDSSEEDNVTRLDRIVRGS